MRCSTGPFLYLLFVSGVLFAGNTSLVTGGAGFLGSHLCDRLIQRGDYVICVDNLSSGSIDNIAHLLDHPSFCLIQQDIVTPLQIPRKVDEIYNLACPASPEFYQKDPLQTLKTNFLGVLNLLQMAAANKAKILQASTSEVYGDPLVHPQVETYWGNVNPYGLRSCYDEGKRVAESLCYAFRLQEDLDVKVVRIFNTFGPRMDPNDGRVVSNFITQSIKNEPLTIYGDGLQTRSLCYVQDLIEGFLLVMAQPKEFGGPVNLGNPSKEMSILEIAETIIELTGSKSAICYRPLPSDDPKKRLPDISLANRQLGWVPKVPIKDGLQQTINYFMKLRAQNSF